MGNSVVHESHHTFHFQFPISHTKWQVVCGKWKIRTWVISKFSSISTKWCNFAILLWNEKQDVGFKKWDVGIHEWEVVFEKWEIRFRKVASRFPHGIWGVGSGTIFKISYPGPVCSGRDFASEERLLKYLLQFRNVIRTTTDTVAPL